MNKSKGYKNNFVMRDEVVLCLAHNTIKFNDFPLCKEIYKISNIGLSFNKLMFIATQKKDKIVGSEIGVNQETFESLKYSTYVDMYKSAPYTALFGVIQKLRNANFTNKVIIMYNTYGGKVDTSSLKEDKFIIDHYDGSIESLEKFISENKITALIVDDIEIVYSLVTRKNINVDGISFIISQLGYNFETSEEDKVFMKYDDLIRIMSETQNFEFGFTPLWEFTEQDFEEINRMG